MDITKVFTTDQDLENNGVWVQIGNKGEKVLVARMYNPAYNAKIRAVMKPYKRKAAQTSSEESLEIMIGVEAETILLNWEGFTEGDKAVKYTVEKAKEYLRLKDFRSLVIEIASNMESFKAQEVAKAEKN